MAETGKEARPPLLRADAALFLDFDGTLAAYAPHPDGVTIEQGLPDLLARLRERLQGALAIVSGRSLEALDALLGPPRFAGSGPARPRMAARRRQDAPLRKSRGRKPHPRCGHGTIRRRPAPGHRGQGRRRRAALAARARARRGMHRLHAGDRHLAGPRGPARPCRGRSAAARRAQGRGAARAFTPCALRRPQARVRRRRPHGRGRLSGRARRGRARRESRARSPPRRAIGSRRSGPCTPGSPRASRRSRRERSHDARRIARPRRHRQLHHLGAHRPRSPRRVELPAAPRRGPGISRAGGRRRRFRPRLLVHRARGLRTQRAGIRRQHGGARHAPVQLQRLGRRSDRFLPALRARRAHVPPADAGAARASDRGHAAHLREAQAVVRIRRAPARDHARQQPHPLRQPGSSAATHDGCAGQLRARGDAVPARSGSELRARRRREPVRRHRGDGARLPGAHREPTGASGRAGSRSRRNGRTRCCARRSR